MMRSLSSVGVGAAALCIVAMTSGCFRAWDDYDPQGGGSGSGAASAALCGGVGALTEDFDDGVIDDRFWSDEDTVLERDGELVFVLPDDAAECSSACMYTESAYSLVGRAIGFELRALPPAPATPTLYATLSDGTGNSVSFVIDLDNVTCRTSAAEDTQTLASQRYDEAAHRFFRFREADGKLRWETSGDGQEWTERAKADLAGLLDARYVSLDLTASGRGGPAPAEIRIDGLNGGEAEPLCAVDALTDDFEDGVRSGAWTVPGCIEHCTMTEAGGELEFAHEVGVSSACSYHTASAYDMRGKAISIELTAPPGADSGGYFTFRLERNSQNHLDFEVYGDSLYCVQALDGECGEQLAFTQFSATDHRWLRFREEAGAVHFETSPDGTQWHSHTSSIDAFALDAVKVTIDSTASSEATAPLTVRVDNFNLAP